MCAPDNARLRGWFQTRHEFAAVGDRMVATVDPLRVLPYVRAMFTFLLVVQAIIAAALVTVILMQRSEGGGLTSSGSPSGLMSARGAADFLTRATSVLASVFVAMSILLAFLAAGRNAGAVDTSLKRRAPAAQTQAAPPAGDDALSDAARNAAAAADNGVPLAH